MKETIKKKGHLPSRQGRLRITALLFALLMTTTFFSSTTAFAVSEPDVPAIEEGVEILPSAAADGDVDVQPTGEEPPPSPSGYSSADSHVLKVHYRLLDALTQNSTEAAHSYIIEVAEGENYRIESPPVDGFTPDNVVVEGVMGAVDVEVTIYYAPVAAVPAEDPPEIAPPSEDKAPPQPAKPQISLFNVSEKHQLVINYFYYDDSSDKLQGGVAAQPYYGEYVAGENYAVDSPVVVGYTPSVRTVNGVMLGENTTLDIWYYKDNQNVYSVRHLFEKKDAPGTYEESASYPLQRKQGTTGSATVAEGHNVSGFVALTITQASVAADGSTEVDVRYNRTSNFVYFNANGGSFVDTVALRFEEAALLPANPARAGHTFAGWFTDAALTQPLEGNAVVMGPRDLNLYAKWTAETVNFTVLYWVETREGQGAFEFSSYQTKSGATGEMTNLTTADLQTSSVLELNRVDNVVLAEDGSSIVHAYYLRKTFTIEFYRGLNGSVWGGWTESIESEPSYTITAKWGTKIADQWAEMIALYPGHRWVVDRNNMWSNMTFGFKTMPGFNYKYYGVPGAVNAHDYFVHTYYESLDQSAGAGEKNWNGIEFYSIPEETGYFSYMDHTCYLTGSNTDTAPGFSYKKGDFEDFDKDNTKQTHHANFFFKRNTLTVTFDTRGGSGSPPDIVERYETDISTRQPAAPSKVGYSFDGWYDNAAAEGTAFTFATMPAKNTRLYAKWTPETHEVTFERNDGSAVVVSSQLVPNLERAQEPASPTRAGYLFGGWHKNRETTGSRYVFDKPVSEALTLYARWVNTHPVDYTVSYSKADTNTAYMPSLSSFGDDGQTRTEEAIIDNIQKYAPDAASKSIVLGNGRENRIEFLYRPFTQLAYRVEHRYANNGRLISSDVLGVQNPTVVTNSENVRVVESYKALVGYLPDKYQKVQALAYEVTEGDIRENVIVFYYTPVDGEEYQVKHYLENPNASSPTDKYHTTPEWVETLRAPLGSTVMASPRSFDGHSYHAAGSTITGRINTGRTLVLSLYYDINRYTVLFDPQGGSPVNSLSNVAAGSLITPPTPPTKEGHTFGGWHTDTSLATQWNFEGDAVNSDVTLYAHWLAETTAPPSPEPDTSTAPPVSSRPALPGVTAPLPGVSSSQIEDSSSEQPPAATDPATDTPLAVPNPSQLTVSGGAVPLGGFTKTGVWSLVNLIFATLGFLVAIVMCIRQLAKGAKKRSQEQEESNNTNSTTQKRHNGAHLVAIAVGVLGALLFLVLENISLPLVLINNRTLMFAIVMGIEVVAVAIGFSKKNKDMPEDQSDKPLTERASKN